MLSHVTNGYLKANPSIILCHDAQIYSKKVIQDKGPFAMTQTGNVNLSLLFLFPIHFGLKFDIALKSYILKIACNYGLPAKF